MQHVQQLEDLKLSGASMVSIGVFDSVHRGHQHLIRALVSEAHEKGFLAGVMTFFPHPDEVLYGDKGRYYLTTIDERAALLAQLDVDYLVTHPFNREVMKIRAADFVERLVKYMQPCCFWVGEDFALGYKREGDVAFLKAAGEELGFAVRAIPLYDDTTTVISSSRIRAALHDAKPQEAADLLGRSYTVTGEVIHGQKRGRDLGYPTANIDVPPGKLIPANGVYAGWATLGKRRLMAAINVGYSPTFGNDAVTVEAYLLDFNEQIYGQTLTLSFELYLRPEMKFNGLDELIAQMARDVETARRFLSEQAAAPAQLSSDDAE